MRIFLFLFLTGSLFAAAPDPDSVAVLYNSSVPESAKLAETYRKARGIPAENLIGLPMPRTDDISRADYDKEIVEPLRAAFAKKGWWTLGKSTPENLTIPVRNRIRYLVTMRGVPLRILNTSPTPVPNDPKKPFEGHNEASVDSELSVFGIHKAPLDGIINNVYFKSEKPIAEANVPFLVLVGRIDAATWDTCERMIHDAVATEKTGLWGRAYVDIANKYPEGDAWMQSVADANLAAGIPTVVDLFHESFAKNYPMTDASLYYGWYEDSVNGPFLNSTFQFRRGAIAVHLHSFSAAQIRDPNRNWSAGLLERGAAGTVGNVFEPYLGLTHHLDIFHKRLLAGATLGEAAYAALPALSWQNVVFGDPLYRPFLHLDESGERQPADMDYRALRLASMEWHAKPDELDHQLQKASERTGSGIFAEAVALHLRSRNRNDDAKQWFAVAKKSYVHSADKLRQDFNSVAIDRILAKKDLASATLRGLRPLYASTPGVEAIDAWLTLMNPPPPPSAPVSSE